MTSTKPVVIVRKMPASPERLFAAWTTPEVLVKWFTTAENQRIAEAEMDVREGGSYKIAIIDPEDRYCAFGHYTRVDRPNLLEFTWQWEESSIEKGVSLVTLEFKALESGTELTLTHTRLESEKSVEAHTQGWTAIMDRLLVFAGQENP